MDGSVTAGWSDFSVAVVGASSALVGLLFVVISLNIEQILGAPALTARSGGTLITFSVPLVVGMLLLVPEQSAAAVGAELVVVGLAAGGSLLWINRPANRTRQEPRLSWLVVRLGSSVAISALLVCAGASLLAGTGGGLYWIAPAVIVALLTGLITAWVLLVEIRR